MPQLTRVAVALAVLLSLGMGADPATEQADAITNTAAAGPRRITKEVNVQIRFEFYNIFNNKNLYLENDLASGGFGKAISQQLPLWWQIGARLTF